MTEKDTCFNVGPNNISSDIKVDADEFPLQQKIEVSEALKLVHSSIHLISMLLLITHRITRTVL